MAKAFLIKGGGGAGGSDEVTVYQKDIPKGLIAITADSDDEIIEGTLELTGSATEDYVVAGKTFYNTDLYQKKSGTLLNRSIVDPVIGGVSEDSPTVAITRGSKPLMSETTASRELMLSIKAPRGYFSGDTYLGVDAPTVGEAGGLTAGKLIGGQSAFGIEGTALDDATLNSNAFMLDGYIGYGKNGVKYTGSIPSLAGHTFTPSATQTSLSCKGKYMTADIVCNAISGLDATKILSGTTIGGVAGILNVQSILSFSAAPYSTNQITFTWKNPAKGAFSGVIIVGKTGSYPTSISDGTRWYKGSGNNTTANGTSTQLVGGFTQGTTYYFRAFAYAVKDGEEWIGESLTATATTKPKGTKTFTSSGTFTVPTGVSSIDVFLVGGGGGGASGTTGTTSTYVGGGGGGAGKTLTVLDLACSAGDTFTVVIGAGGSGGSAGGSNGGSGNSTTFGSYSAAGGSYGAGYKTGYGGSGGSGGGAGGYRVGYPGGAGGSNGGSGTDTYGSDDYGVGQGTTTRAFGESSNTLYAGGGGGGGKGTSYSAYTSGGAGGSGGGGAGGSGGGENSDNYVWPTAGSAGTANTGGGGGGGGKFCHVSTVTPSGGAGGSGICIVRWGY